MSYQDSYHTLRKKLEGEDLFLCRYSTIAGTNVHETAIYGYRSTGFAFYDNNADMGLTQGYLSILDIAAVIDRGATVLMGDEELQKAYNLLQGYFYALGHYTRFPNGELPTQEEMLRLDAMQEKLFDMVKFGTKGVKFAQLMSERMTKQTGAQVARQMLNPLPVVEGQRQVIDRRVGLSDLISPETLMNAPLEDTGLKELDPHTFLPPTRPKLRFT